MTVSKELIEERKLASVLMDLIDGFIGLQLKAKNLDEKDKYEFLVKNYRKMLADDFEFHTKNHRYSHKVYLHQIRHKESGPYAENAFSINSQPNLLNL